MNRDIRTHILKKLRLRESWVIFFLLGLIMLNYPFIHIFNKPIKVFELPLLFIYLEVGWAVSIFVIYLFTLAAGIPEDESRSDETGERR